MDEKTSAKRMQGLLDQKRLTNQLLRERCKTGSTPSPAQLVFRAPPIEEEDIDPLRVEEKEVAQAQ